MRGMSQTVIVGPSDRDGRVRGDELEFRAGGREYRGRMKGKTLELR